MYRQNINPSSPTESYLELIRQFRLRPIQNDTEYEAATRAMVNLAIRAEGSLDVGEQDYLDGLSEFISAYDRTTTILRWRGTVHQRLISLLRDSETTPADLQKLLHCSHSLVSLILSGKRELSKANIAALARHFKISTDFFFDGMSQPKHSIRSKVESPTKTKSKNVFHSPLHNHSRVTAKML